MAISRIVLSYYLMTLCRPSPEAVDLNGNAGKKLDAKNAKVKKTKKRRKRRRNERERQRAKKKMLQK